MTKLIFYVLFTNVSNNMAKIYHNELFDNNM